MVIVKLMGGLGNQMFQYALAKSIEINTSAVVELDITGYDDSECSADFRLNKFNISLEAASDCDIRRLKGDCSFAGKLLRRLGLTSFYRERERTVFDSNVYDKAERYLWGYWQNEKYFNDIRSVLLQDFTLSEECGSKCDFFLDKINGSECSVSIHVRRGDYLEIEGIGVLPMVYYEEAVSLVKKRYENCHFFVFSNDLAWCEKEFKWLDDATFVLGCESEIEDMYLMTNCDHHIVANSSFSWWAAWLNPADGKLIVCPKRWVAENPKGYCWAPDSWIAI